MEEIKTYRENLQIRLGTGMGWPGNAFPIAENSWTLQSAGKAETLACDSDFPFALTGVSVM